MRFDLVIATVDRTDDLERLLASLEAQTHRAFRIVVVDQNDDDSLANAVEKLSPSFPLKQLHVPKMRGASRGRNLGFENADGDVICFPDDDCTYPPKLLDDVLKLFDEKRVDIVCGRAADESGRDINGRFEAEAQEAEAELEEAQKRWPDFPEDGVFVESEKELLWFDRESELEKLFLEAQERLGLAK